MPSNAVLLALSALPLAALATTLTNETVLGIYMFHRHGDRTAKEWPPDNLTGLGYQEVYTSGTYYRNRYVVNGAPYQISGISPDVVLQADLAVSAPDDTVLQNSANGFLQGLYPPTGAPYDMSTLRNGTTITAPMNGYQLIPVELAASGTGSEDSTWLQSTSGCAQAEVSSNEYFMTPEYNHLLKSTQAFYDNIWPVINGTFNKSSTSYFNAYEIYDLVNVAEIHNHTINSAHLLTPDVLFQLRTLADQQQWHLGYNKSEPIRAIAGATLAAQIVQFLNASITDAGASKMGIQFGAYNSFASFFGLADLTVLGQDWYGIVGYASSMVFEMFTNSSAGPFTATNYPSPDDIYVRFLFHNGTANTTSHPVAYPLFGLGQEVLRWKDFHREMNKFAIGNTQQWCTACANYTGSCAAFAPAGQGSSDSSSSGSGCSNGISPAVNGVIGAMVTLAVVLGLEALILLIAGLRVVSKKRLRQPAASPNGSEK